LISLCSALLPGKSKGELRRLIQGCGVTINSEKITNPHLSIKDVTQENFKLKTGKRDFYYIFFLKA